MRLFRVKPRPLYAVKHPVSGKGWCGPYAHNGNGYSQHTKLWYRFKSENAAQVTLTGCAMHDHKIQQM